jgi:hypothetical protein
LVKKTKLRLETFSKFALSVNKTNFSDLEKRISPRDDGNARDDAGDEFVMRKTSSFFIFFAHRKKFCKRIAQKFFQPRSGHE